MSYFAIITFDLSYPGMSLHGTNVYKKITDRLEDLDFYKARHGKRSTPFELPANTYVAEFEEEEYDKSSELADEIKADLKEILADLEVHGKFFVFVGKKWAWRGDKV
ncbi:hypothetical protein QZM93_30945 [Burkholderia cepacia]|uniref:hypothetical protein n=1 Tax=Burkholderia cepacia TaxID=292 RepID=UPI0011AC198E|nr:hypothetical protein [Burkholderia cepacia]MDN7893027.1 hypothetical protein [Burkholderia cepacia]